MPRRLIFAILVAAIAVLTPKCLAWVPAAHFRRDGSTLKIRMSTLAPPKRTSATGGGGDGKKKSGLAPEQMSKYVIGGRYSGRVTTCKTFGCFVSAGDEASILLPRSSMSRGSFEKLGSMAAAKSTQLVDIEVTGMDPEAKTLSARYVDPNASKLSDISSLIGTDLSGRQFLGTVVSSHEFGVFVELDEYGCEGLVPQSMLPRGESKPKPGSSVSVKIEELGGADGKKLLLSMRDSSSSSSSSSSSAASAFGSIPNTRWVQGVVQSVTNFGLFVRPAGFDSTGLVHNSRVPRDLISSLKRRLEADSTSSSSSSSQAKTDVEMLFQAGDVIKVRVNGVNNGKTELSMLPHRASDDEEDDYVVEGRDPEDTEGNPMANYYQREEDEESDYFNAEDTLLWWRGAPFVKSAWGASGPAGLLAVSDPEAEVVMESKAVVEGTWRRMFEVDMREDQADFSTKVREADLKEMEEEIGELSGLDEDLMDRPYPGLGAGVQRVAIDSTRLGNYIAQSVIPREWQSGVDFFSSVTLADEAKISALRQGKKSEQTEFEALLREVEAELEVAAARMRGGRSSDSLSSAGPSEGNSAAAAAPSAPLDA